MQELIGTAYCSDVFPSSQHIVFPNCADVQRCGGKHKREEVGWWKGPRVKVGHGIVDVCRPTHQMPYDLGEE